MAAGYSAASDLANKIRVQQARAKQMGANPGQLGAPVDPVPGDIASARAIQGMVPPTFAPGSSPLPQPQTRWTFAGPSNDIMPAGMKPQATPDLMTAGTPTGQVNQGYPGMARAPGFMRTVGGGAPAATSATPPAPSAATATPGATVYGGEMGPPAPPGGIDRTRFNQIAVAQAKLHHAREGMQFGGKSALAYYGGPEGLNTALGDNWKGARDLNLERMELDNANRPVQGSQGPAAIAGNHEELFYKGLSAVDSLRQRVAAEPDPQKKVAMIAEADRMEQAFRSNLAPYKGGAENPEVTRINQAQAAAGPAERANRDQWYEAAQSQGSVNKNSEQFRIDSMVSRAAVARAKMGAEKADAQHAQLIAEAGVDPTAIKSEVATRQQLAKAKALAAETESTRAQSALSATQAVAGGEQAMAPLADPRLDNAVKAFTATLHEGVGMFGSGSEPVAKLAASVASIKGYISSLPPEQAAAVKAHLRSTLPLSSASSLTDIVGYNPVGIVNRQRQLHAVADLREFLSQ